MNTEADFWALAIPEPMTGCWLWLGGATSDPRPRPRFWFQGKPWDGHRLAVFFSTGRVPSQVNHRCDQTLCVNPAHLYEGTQRDNMLDRVRRGRWAGGCPPTITDAQVVDIRRRATRGDRHRQIARDYGIAQSTVSRIASGETRGG